MKCNYYILLLSILLIGSFSKSIGQIVPSSCITDNVTKQKFKEDTYYITNDIIWEKNLSYKDSIEFPINLIDSVRRALIAVYNSTLPARDTIIQQLDIHHYQKILLNVVKITADSGAPWMRELKLSIVPTGNKQMDSLITKYGIIEANYWYDIPSKPWHYVYFYFLNNFYNINAMLTHFKVVQGLRFAEVDSIVGDGNKIYCEFNTGFTTLKYYYQWGDCPAGCIYSRMWEFKVYPDCSVEYVGSSGNKLPLTGIGETVKKEISLSPNPFVSTLRVNGIQKPTAFCIHDISGRLVKKGITKDGVISDLDDLLRGLYFITLNYDQSSSTYKIIKE